MAELSHELSVCLTDRALSVLLSEGVDRSECDKSLMKETPERDQECGKSQLNGTALDEWALNRWFSSAA